uniref:Uncharacterized protein n=1 Tax=Bracon brevicornis TaxID=1563983 RepID=A0A6V7IW57_9HYME
MKLKLYLGDTDCGEGGANRPTRGVCDPPEGPCTPMKPPGYPAKPRPAKEPFCVKCPPKRPCNLNKCPTDTDGTCSTTGSKEIALILYSQSQRSCSRHRDWINHRNYGTYNGRSIIENLKYKTQIRWKSSKNEGCGNKPDEYKNQLPKPPETCEKKVMEIPVCKPKETKAPPTTCGSATKNPDPPVRIVYQKCPPLPKLPKLPECVPPVPKVEIKCPPLPDCPKPPVCPKPMDETKCASSTPPEEPKCGLPPETCSSKKPGIFDKLSGLFKKRKMSTSSSSGDWKSRKCKTITDICTTTDATSNNGKTSTSPAHCPKERKTSCHIEKFKCSDKKEAIPIVEKPPEIQEKMDYTKVTCPPSKFAKLDSCPSRVNSTQAESFVDNPLTELPKPPSEPVTLCPCPPPPRLHPGECPCAPEPHDLKRIFSVQSCVPKDKFPCPEKKVFYCPPQRHPQSNKTNS